MNDPTDHIIMDYLRDSTITFSSDIFGAIIAKTICVSDEFRHQHSVGFVSVKAVYPSDPPAILDVDVATNVWRDVNQCDFYLQICTYDDRICATARCYTTRYLTPADAPPSVLTCNFTRPHLLFARIMNQVGVAAVPQYLRIQFPFTDTPGPDEDITFFPADFPHSEPLIMSAKFLLGCGVTIEPDMVAPSGYSPGVLQWVSRLSSETAMFPAGWDSQTIIDALALLRELGIEPILQKDPYESEDNDHC